MIVIGEKINGAIPAVGKAIAERNKVFIQTLALKETEDGADYLDVCAGTDVGEEWDALKWLIETVQEVTETPLCLDSPNPHILEAAMSMVKRPGIMNSASGEGDKCKVIFPLLRDNEWKVILLTCNDDGIPADGKSKIEIAGCLIETAEGYGIDQDRIYVDPLVMSVSTVNSSMLDFIEAVKGIKTQYPDVKITSGLSNISYGMPCRKLINKAFLAMALQAGMDSAIMDPGDREMLGTILAAEVLMGQDKYCRRYNRAYRAGKIGKKNSK